MILSTLSLAIRDAAVAKDKSFRALSTAQEAFFLASKTLCDKSIARLTFEHLLKFEILVFLCPVAIEVILRKMH
jgi:hypothetical protein